jgi:hypothetical protein
MTTRNATRANLPAKRACNRSNSADHRTTSTSTTTDPTSRSSIRSGLLTAVAALVLETGVAGKDHGLDPVGDP